jgi:hypothetical protein
MIHWSPVRAATLRSTSLRSRATAVVAVAVIAGLALSGCSNKKVRSAEDWLADQEFVLGVETVDAAIGDLPYDTVLRAELDPLATADDIEKLVSDTIREVKPGTELGVHFGILGLDFDVTTRSKTADAFALWRDIDDVPDIDSALALSDFVYASTPRETLVAVFDELAGFGVGVRVDGGKAGAASTVAIVRPNECEPPAGTREYAIADAVNEAVRSATYDLCEGFDVVYTNSTVFDATIASVLATVDAAGLSAFPVRVSVAPPTPASTAFHIVELTPGTREALGIVTALDAADIRMRYELFAPASDGELRALTIESDAATLEELYELLAASPVAVFLGDLTIMGTDGTFEGDFEEFGEEMAPEPTATPKPTASPTPTPTP